MPVNPNWRNEMLTLYNQILEMAKELPEGNFYRKEMEKAARFRIKGNNSSSLDLQKQWWRRILITKWWKTRLVGDKWNS